MKTRISLITLALIGALIIAGNLVVDRDGGDSGVKAPSLAYIAVSSETPVGVAFQFGSMIEAHRDRAEAAEVAAQQAAQAKKDKAKQQRKRFSDLPGSVTQETLDAIASCESGGDPKIVSSSGLYYGKYQFSPDTWESVGGKGLPSEASETEQDYRAALLYERSGPGQWPVCGQ